MIYLEKLPRDSFFDDDPLPNEDVRSLKRNRNGGQFNNDVVTISVTNEMGQTRRQTTIRQVKFLSECEFFFIFNF